MFLYRQKMNALPLLAEDTDWLARDTKYLQEHAAMSGHVPHANTCKIILFIIIILTIWNNLSCLSISTDVNCS